MQKYKIITQRLDAEESIFFARSLEHILTTTQEIDYPELKARTVIPINTESPSGTTSITYREYDRTGMAKMIANYAEDLPRIDILGKEVTAKVRTLGASFGYTIADIKRARLTGISLDQKKAQLTQEAFRRKENSLAFLGDSNYGMASFLDHPNITPVTLLADGTGTSKAFSTKTADQIIRDVESLISAPSDVTNDIENPNVVAFSPRTYNYLKGKKVGVDSSMTVLKFLMENNPGVTFMKLLELKNLGDSGTTDRMIAFRRDPSKLEMHIVQDFEMLSPQERGLEFVVPCYEEFGGTTVYKPLSIAYADGVFADA
jgi:hypothetical protein